MDIGLYFIKLQGYAFESMCIVMFSRQETLDEYVGEGFGKVQKSQISNRKAR